MGQLGGVFVMREHRLRGLLPPREGKAAGPQEGGESDLFNKLMFIDLPLGVRLGLGWHSPGICISDKF